MGNASVEVTQSSMNLQEPHAISTPHHERHWNVLHRTGVRTIVLFLNIDASQYISSLYPTINQLGNTVNASASHILNLPCEVNATSARHLTPHFAPETLAA